MSWALLIVAVWIGFLVGFLLSSVLGMNRLLEREERDD